MELEQTPRHETAAAASAAAAPPAGHDVDMGGCAAAAPVSAAAASIPYASYVMPPSAPSWRVKAQFSSWQVDHARFQLQRLVGKGSYGQVCEGIDHLTGARVAIKKIGGLFDVLENAKRILREVRTLRHMDHPNIVKILHIQQPPMDLLAFTDIYVVFEGMDTDLAKLTRDDTQCLTLPHVRWFLYQLLLALKYCHSARVLHRDIKPANLLLSEACELKLCDFGLARTLDDENDEGICEEHPELRDTVGVQAPPLQQLQHHDDGPASHTGVGGISSVSDGSAPAASGGGSGSTGGGSVPPDSGAGMQLTSAGGAPLSASSSPAVPVSRQLTRHVVTRWYRAPELPLYNDGAYDTPVDVWSVGCVFAELLGMLDTGDPDCRYDRRALFPGGSCYPMSRDRAKDRTSKEKKDQLAVIFEVLGTPTEQEIAGARIDAARGYLASLPCRQPEDLSARFPTATPEALELLRGMLRFHPGDRLSVEAALSHPFLAPVRRPHDEVGRPGGAIKYRRVTAENVRQLMVEEIRAFNPAIPANWHELATAHAYEAPPGLRAAPAGGGGGADTDVGAAAPAAAGLHSS